MARIDRIADPWGTRTSYAAGERWPVRVDTCLEEGVSEGDVDRWVQTERCHPQTLLQARWANAKLKESSAQTLVS